MIEKYLSKYSVEILLDQDFTDSLPIYDKAVCVPARREPDISSLIKSLSDSAKHSKIKALLCLVINDVETHNTNRQLFKNVISHSVNGLEKPGYYWGEFSESLDFLIIDRFTPNRYFSAKEGVGFARKIGCDHLLYLCTLGKLKDKWLYNTDADVQVPLEYFIPAEMLIKNGTQHKTQTQKPGAVNFNITHDFLGLSNSELKAAQLYDAYLKYYFRQMTIYCPRHAFLSVGSLMVIHADAYIKVRGFPNLMAGEDFHMLNKINKFASIIQLDSPSLTVKARLSSRTPFGTGVSIEKISEKITNKEGYLLMSPDTFKVVRILDQLARNFLVDKSTQIFKYEYLDTHYTKKDEIPDPLELATVINNTMNYIDFKSIVDTAKASSPAYEKRLKSFECAFDALQIFRAINFITRTQLLPAIDATQII